MKECLSSSKIIVRIFSKTALIVKPGAPCLKTFSAIAKKSLGSK